MCVSVPPAVSLSFLCCSLFSPWRKWDMLGVFLFVFFLFFAYTLQHLPLLLEVFSHLVLQTWSPDVTHRHNNSTFAEAHEPAHAWRCSITQHVEAISHSWFILISDWNSTLDQMTPHHILPHYCGAGSSIRYSQGFRYHVATCSVSPFNSWEPS